MDEQQIKQIIREEFTKYLEPKIDRIVLQKHMQILDARNIQIGRENGTKIGTATDQKLAFFGTTPVDKPATVADASIGSVAGAGTIDAGAVATNFTSCQTAINAIIDRLQELGLIA